MIELDSVVKEFLVESYENLDQLDRHLCAARHFELQQQAEIEGQIVFHSRSL